MLPPIDPGLAAHLAGLTPEQLFELSAYARKLGAASRGESPSPPGTPGAELLRFAGVLSGEEAAQMMEDIEAGCGQVHHAGW